jgi:hypothetical protein
MWLLPVYGILGAAYASLAALLIYNLLKLVLVVVNYKIQPYSSKTIVVLVLSIGIYFAVTNMSSVENLYLDIIIKSFVSLFVYLGICYKINLSTSINQLIDKLLRRA